MSKKTVKKKVTTTTIIEEEVVNNNEITQIVAILDRSGSMASIINDAIGGFNEFLNKQRNLEDKATMTVALFDDQYDLLYDNIDIKEVPDFTREVWSPMGMTNLYDAIGKTITQIKNTHNTLNESEKPDKVLVCIVTDGYHNVNGEYSIDNVKKIIGECEKEGWSFVYLAANQDAFSVGTSFGISAGNTYSFNATAKGMENISSTLTNAATYYRSVSSDSITYSANLMNEFGVDEEKNN